MALTLRCSELDGLFFQVKETNSLHLVYSVFCVYMKCGEWILASLYTEDCPLFMVYLRDITFQKPNPKVLHC
jgi:hypothetical protein